jgi:hypothetical protein
MINCVNHKSKDVIDIADGLGVHPAIAASKIALWQDKNGINEFPTIEDLINNESENSNLVVEKLIPEINFNDLIGNTTESIFTETSENKTDDSDFGKPIDILFNGNTSNLDVNVILNNIIENVPDITVHTAELIKRAKILVGKSKVKIKLVSAEKMVDGKTVMQYESNTNEIQLSLDTINNFDSKTAVVAFLHEIVHSLTVHAMMKKPENRTFAEQDLVDTVNNFLKKYKDSSLKKDYGFTDEFEFVAEFYANPEFRDAVKELSDSWYKQIMDTIRRLFDINKNPEYTKLFDTIINFVEGTNEDFVGIKHYDRVFAKKAEFKKPILNTMEDRLNYLVGQAKDNINQVRARTAASKKHKSKKEQKEHLKNITALLTEMEKIDEAEKWKVVLQYAKTMSKTVFLLNAKTNTLLNKSKDIRKDNLINTINSYQDYLASYDLKKEIDDILSDAIIFKSKLTSDELLIVTEISSIMNTLSGTHDTLVSLYDKIKKEQAIKELARPEYNTQVETDHRDRLAKEYVQVKPLNESKYEYISRMLATRDKLLYEEDLIKAAEKIVNDPAFDITAFTKSWGNPLNTSSKLIQIITNIVNTVREKIISQYKDYDLFLGEFYKTYKEEKGNKPPSQLYKNIYEQDKDGNYFFKGKYSIRFRDVYLEEYKPLEEVLLEIEKTLKEKGLTKLEMRAQDEYKQAKLAVDTWMKAHTVKDHTDVSGRSWVPKKEYLNPEVTGVDKDLLKEAIHLVKLGHKNTHGKRSLIRRTGAIQFFKFPSITKNDFERGLELDFKGYIADKKANLTEVRPDDIGYGEAVSNKNESLKNIKIHFRGNIKPDQQSLDVFTILRKEYLNILSYKEKSKEETTILLLADISKTKNYYQVSKKTGLPLMNSFNENEQAVFIKGEFTNEYSRIKGLIERNLYDTFHEAGGTFLGADMNKLTSYINGLTASIAMSFNIASATANVFNGFTQLFIESFGADTFNTKSLLKAEKKYTLELPEILKDLANPTKTSFINQMLEMFDVFGGFDPATQDFIRDNIAKRLASRKNLNGLNEMGEHAMNAVVTMAVLDSLKVMNSNHKYIDKDGNVVDEKNAVSLLDMLKKDSKGKLVVDSKVKYTKHNLTVEYNKGGNVHINLLIKNKIFDLFGVYDINFKNEVSKHWLGKSVMMFKNYFLGGFEYRYTGFSTSWKNKEDLSEEELNYNSAKKEYVEGIYTSLIRYFKEGVIPALKNLQLMYMKDTYNSLSEHEKANLKKATLEIMLTSVMIPLIGALLAAGADADDDELWFLIYQFRRLESELSQFRNPIEATKLITNPVAGIKLIQNGLSLIYEIGTPIDFVPKDNEHFFSYLNEDSKNQNILIKKAKKLRPVLSQFNKNWKQLHSLIDK